MGSRPSQFVLTSPGRLRLYSTAELLLMPRPVWQIEEIFPAGGLVGLYGPPGSGKSFIAIDMAMSIATGTPWQGKAVHADYAGFGLYVAAEGGVGIVKRAQAWLQHHGLKASQVPVGWLMESMPVYGDSEDVDVLIERVREVQMTPAVIVVDTLARCFDGDENQQVDMGRFIKGVDRLRHDFKTTVIVVHHTRLGGDRERGNTAFRGACDTMISVSGNMNDGGIEVVCAKQKDAIEFEDLQMYVQDVPGTESCVLTGEDRSPSAGQQQERMGQICAILQDKGPLTWDETLASSSIPRTTFYRAFMELKKEGKIIKENDKWRSVVSVP